MTTNLIYGYNIFLGIIFLIFLFVGVWAFMVFLRNFKAELAKKREKDPKTQSAHDEPPTAKVAVIQTPSESTVDVATGPDVQIVSGPSPKVADLDTLRGRGESTDAGKIRYYEVISERRHRV